MSPTRCFGSIRTVNKRPIGPNGTVLWSKYGLQTLPNNPRSVYTFLLTFYSLGGKVIVDRLNKLGWGTKPYHDYVNINEKKVEKTKKRA